MSTNIYNSMTKKPHIMLITHTMLFAFLSAQTRSIYTIVVSRVFATRKSNKIFRSVIEFIFVNMVHYFSTPTNFQVSSQFFHKYLSMFSDITIFISEWMIRVKNIAIAIAKKLTTFPLLARRTSNVFFLPFSTAFNRTSFSSTLTKFPTHYLKRRITNLTDHFRVFHTQISYSSYITLTTG